MKQEPIIHQNGIYFGMPNEEYHADPAMGSSGIKELCISPLHYWANSHMNPHRIKKETEAQNFGDLVHNILLEGGGQNTVVKPEGMSFATKEGKAWRQEQLDCGLEIISQKDNAALQMILLAADRSGLTECLAGGIPEVAYFWTDESGFRCKIKTDMLQPHCGYDLKTFANTMDKDLETCIAQTVANRRYHISAYWYHVGINHMRQALLKGRAKYFAHDREVADPEIKFLQDMNTTGKYPYWYAFLEKGGVPNIIIRQFTPKNAGQTEMNSYWRAAKNSVKWATQQYATNLEKYGEEPWIDPAIMKSFDDLDFGAARWILEE